ncbi:MAG: LuxR C-terminal-related transcriptional regulator [Pseudonocardiaceae bacterium]
MVDISLSLARIHDVEGLRVAELVRTDYPDVGLLMLSAHVEPAYAQRLLTMEDNPRAVGYLGKEHLGNLDELIDAFHRIIRDGTVIDSEIISQLMSRRRVTNPLDRLTPYHKRILGLVAEGHSNLGIAQRLDCKISTVEQHLSTIFDKLGLAPETSHDRRRMNLRVLATLTFLRNTDRLSS